MRRNLLIKTLLAGSSAAAIALTATSAMAAGFSSRQQSATGQGFSFAGAGTSVFGIGSMFWNPAAITNFEGRNSEWNASLINPNTSVTADRYTSPSGATNLFGAPFNVPALGSGNINQGTLTTASYNSYQVNNWLWLGMQSGAPYGSRTKADTNFAGSIYGSSTTVRAVAATPTLGFKLNDWVSFGLGVTIQQLNVTLKSTGRNIGQIFTDIHGDGMGIGWTAGVTLKPFSGTEISLGYRSHIKHQLNGEFDVAAAGGAFLSSRLIRTNVNLPEIATLGIAQKLNDQWTLTGTAQWTNWSRIGIAPLVNRATGAPITGLGFRYKDEWFFSGGVQYAWNESLKMRAGFAYEISPVTDETRGVRVLDANRLWASVGFGYKFNNSLELDVGYSHLLLQKGRVDIVAANNAFNPAGNPSYVAGGPQFNGSSKGSVDIISASLKYRWDAPAAAPVRPVVTKY